VPPPDDPLISDGSYPWDSFLPAQRDLAEEFGVSRDTVQRAFRELSSEGWIESRQGVGSRVIGRQRIHTPASSRRPFRRVTLGSILGQAFERVDVTLDVFTLTSESLEAHIRLQAERIRIGEIAPQRIAPRLLLPSEDLLLPYPRVTGDPDDLRLQERLRESSGSARPRCDPTFGISSWKGSWGRSTWKSGMCSSPRRSSCICSTARTRCTVCMR
jgi:DNA-binding transcriptional regulator YhcF (GntR family)